MAEKRSAPIDDTPAKEAKVDPSVLPGFDFGLTKRIHVNCDGPMILDESFVKYSSIIATMRAKSTYIELPGDNIPLATWIFINKFVVNRGFEGNPPTEYSLAQLFFVLEKYKINAQDIFLPKQYATWRDELLICIKNDMFRFNDVFNGSNLNIYFDFVTELFCSSTLTIIKQTPNNTLIDSKKIYDSVQNLVYYPRLHFNVTFSVLCNFRRNYIGTFELKE